MDTVTVSGISFQTVRYEKQALPQINALIKRLSPKAVPMTLIALRTMLSSHSLFVARNDKNDIIGMATLIRYQKLSRGWVGIIEDVIVDAKYRGQGIGRKLMEHAIESGRASGLAHIDLTSKPQRVEARALYTSLGFVERDTSCFRLIL